ncbi:MAG TPA: AAA family ATPase [Lentisphaeria bacterium]|nr:MAG: AAA family ATPase [Lentisphaerae bacterium GWF2_50_93]HCE45959.1 AAA family ATPase [Lentisphaeria bacterium]
MILADEKHYLLAVSLERDRISSFEQYPYSLPVCRHLDTLKLHPAVTFFIGENGTGKSTLLEAMAVAAGFNAEGGSRNMRFSTRESHSPLHDVLSLRRSLKRPRDGYFLRAESFFNVASEIEHLDAEAEKYAGLSAPPIINSYGSRSLHEQSHGESFLKLVMERFGGHGLYILDEPEAALSPTRQLSLLVRIHELVKQGSQFIVATHSPIIMAYPEATIYQLSEEDIKCVKYTETEHYTVTRDFLNRHESTLKDLLTE